MERKKIPLPPPQPKPIPPPKPPLNKRLKIYQDEEMVATTSMLATETVLDNVNAVEQQQQGIKHSSCCKCVVFTVMCLLLCICAVQLITALKLFKLFPFDKVASDMVIPDGKGAPIGTDPQDETQIAGPVITVTTRRNIMTSTKVTTQRNIMTSTKMRGRKFKTKKPKSNKTEMVETRKEDFNGQTKKNSWKTPTFPTN